MQSSLPSIHPPNVPIANATRPKTTIFRVSAFKNASALVEAPTDVHCRAVLGLPIPGIKQERIGASAVILSPIASQERPNYRGMEEVTKEEDTYLRIFGKPTTRVNRRMGVVLCYAPLDSDLDTLRDKAKRIADRVEVY